MKHGLIPPSLHFERPNPAINFASSPFYVADRLLEWNVDAGPRRAGVSSFGIGGTNSHVVLEEAPAAAPSGASRPSSLLVWSARSESALEAATANLADHLRGHETDRLADIAYTLSVGRTAYNHRRCLVCQGHADAIDALGAARGPRLMTAVQEQRDRKVVMMFSGQGTQHVGMGFELYRDEPEFRQQLDRCAELLEPELSRDLRDILYPGRRQRGRAQTSCSIPPLPSPLCSRSSTPSPSSGLRGACARQR